MPSSSGRRSSKTKTGLLFDPLPSHADPEHRTIRKSKEKECGGFDWTPGIAMALLGAMTLLDVQKSIEKKERREKEEEERQKRRRSSVSSSSAGRSRYGSGSSSSSRRDDRYENRYDNRYDDRYDERYYNDDRDGRHSYDRGYDHRDRRYSSRRGSW